MNKRDAKRWACSWLASRAEHSLAAADLAGDDDLSESDKVRLDDALAELMNELRQRAGEHPI